MYRVIEGFHDLQDNGHEYRMGDDYPREGYAPAPERIRELSGSDNARRSPLIAEIAEEASAAPARRSRRK